jgi:hypothetical protein
LFFLALSMRMPHIHFFTSETPSSIELSLPMQ